MTNSAMTFSKDLAALIDALGSDAKAASSVISQLPEAQVNKILHAIADAIDTQVPNLLAANQKDLSTAQQRGLTAAMIDRLTLNDDRIAAIAEGVRQIAALPDPTGRILWQTERPNGLKIERTSVPIGVLGMVYESRPNVTVDAAALCLKSRNAVILRGGSESLQSSLAFHAIIQSVLEANNLPGAAVSMVSTPDRAAVGAMLACHHYIDVMIPRGGKGLVERVMNEARMPVFAHLEGLCHIYIDQSVDATIAREVTLNAKMRRTGICGATETVLLDKALSPEISKNTLTTLLDAGCEVRGDDQVQLIDDRITAANEDDWHTEYLDAIISVKFVDGVDEAIHHINHYGSHHTDSILAENSNAADAFLNRVDSGIVLHNASTQFADGGEFGMGAEIGIATSKMHARGPVGLEQLCTYKYRVRGNGQTRPK